MFSEDKNKVSYLNTIKIWHRCSGCGKKKHFINTGKFRVNANGNRVDVWLIYQCEKCKHTLNLTVYERKRPGQISQEEYDLFLDNDEKLAMEYGNDIGFLKRNKVEFKK